MAEEILRKVDVDWLLCLYGSMLTDKQREIAALYFEEDYSLAEIAQQENVSRQSVHDTLHRVEKQLRMLEEKLGLRRRLNGVEEALRQALDALPKANETIPARDCLEKALRLLNDEEETNGL
ncbi:MAG: hypothetical protein IJ214_06880 [Clostridia bacterium]|nr:hypothetical protein [Clostridia bacterium]